MYQMWYSDNKITPRLCDIINKMQIQIFDDTWCTYIPEHKKELCSKIIRRYYFNNICCETPERFVFYLNEHLARIMPYYNQLYKSELIKINPLLNHSIEQNSRSIENLLKTMKTDQTATGKVLRDFVQNTAGYSDNTAITGVKSKENLDKTVQNVYNKIGTDDSTTDTVENTAFHEDKNSTTDRTDNRDINEVTTSNTTGNETGNKTEVLDGTRVTDTDNSLEKTQSTVSKDTDTGTIVDDGVGTSKSNGTKDWTEVKDDDASTKVVTDLNEKTRVNARKDYADTPQINLGSSGGGTGSSNIINIRTDYLTNVTWDTSTSNHELNSTVDTTYADDETKTHTEKTSDNTNTTDKNTKTTNMIKDGTEDVTINQTEDNSENQKTDNTTTTDHTVDTTEKLDKTVKTDDDLTSHITEQTTTDSNTERTENSKYDDDWTENGNAKEVTTHELIGTKNTDARVTGKDTKEGREKEAQETGRASISSEDTTRTTDTGTTDVTRGFMNVSASNLLEAFRKTFLNIDAKIIEDIADNFLSIY